MTKEEILKKIELLRQEQYRLYEIKRQNAEEIKKIQMEMDDLIYKAMTYREKK